MGRQSLGRSVVRSDRQDTRAAVRHALGQHDGQIHFHFVAALLALPRGHSSVVAEKNGDAAKVRLGSIDNTD